MFRSKNVLLAAAVLLASAGLVNQALSQFGGPGGGPWGVGGDPEQNKKIMEQWQKDNDERMKKTLGANEEEWVVIQPKLETVTKLSNDLSGMMMFMAKPRPTSGPDVANQPPSVTEAALALRKILQDKEAKTEDIAAAMKAYRDAKTKAKAELEKAQKALREVLTTKQEAQLLSLGLLE